MKKSQAEKKMKNIAGTNIKALRKALKIRMSQKKFAEMLQLSGLDITKNMIQELEAGDRYIKDYELLVIAQFFDVSVDELLS